MAALADRAMSARDLQALQALTNALVGWKSAPQSHPTLPAEFLDRIRDVYVTESAIFEIDEAAPSATPRGESSDELLLLLVQLESVVEKAHRIGKGEPGIRGKLLRQRNIARGGGEREAGVVDPARAAAQRLHDGRKAERVDAGCRVTDAGDDHLRLSGRQVNHLLLADQPRLPRLGPQIKISCDHLGQSLSAPDADVALRQLLVPPQVHSHVCDHELAVRWIRDRDAVRVADRFARGITGLIEESRVYVGFVERVRAAPLHFSAVAPVREAIGEIVVRQYEQHRPARLQDRGSDLLPRFPDDRTRDQNEQYEEHGPTVARAHAAIHPAERRVEHALPILRYLDIVGPAARLVLAHASSVRQMMEY